MRKHNMGEIVFFGKITASVTHEQQNVLAIIQESAGLMEDLLTFSAEGSDSLNNRLEKSLTVIKKQLRRGIDLTTCLNRFAHSPDQPLTQIDLYEITEQMTILSSRFAALKEVVLINHAPDQPIQIVINLVQLQIALFSSIEYCLDLLTPGGQLDISLEKQSKMVLVKLLFDENFLWYGGLVRNLPRTSHWESLVKNMISLEGSVEFYRSGNGIVLVLPQ
ncbi:hypothetical protein HOG48_03315 [Candidatus Peregrinibacteria bacterium]|jgi:C4-dicarboxylate-specific signal transduction histidine kinase|nr:hypothetical protein [Candidatus Peregrinibacteria bacterium]